MSSDHIGGSSMDEDGQSDPGYCMDEDEFVQGGTDQSESASTSEPSASESDHEARADAAGPSVPGQSNVMAAPVPAEAAPASTPSQRPALPENKGGTAMSNCCRNQANSLLPSFVVHALAELMYARERIVRTPVGQPWTCLKDSVSRLQQLDQTLGAAALHVLQTHTWDGVYFTTPPNITALNSDLQRIITGMRVFATCFVPMQIAGMRIPPTTTSRRKASGFSSCQGLV